MRIFGFGSEKRFVGKRIIAQKTPREGAKLKFTENPKLIKTYYGKNQS